MSKTSFSDNIIHKYKNILLLTGIIIFFILFIILIKGISLQKNKSTKLRSIVINNHTIYIELADNDKSRERGLSGRTFMDRDSGMLFNFPKKGYYNFWMKGMNFPLDFIWIEKNIVVDTTENVPPPKSIDQNFPTITSRFPADKVLEINAGLIKLYNIKTGDVVDL